MTETGEVPEVDPAKPTVAGIYDAYLGGTHHSQREREMADQIREAVPEINEVALVNRAFHQRATRWMVGAGIRQFIDLGSGLPTQENTHEVAQRLAPETKVVYVDHNPHAVRLGRELVADNPNVAFLEMDVRDADGIFSSPEVCGLLDKEQPIGVIATAVLHFMSDVEAPWELAGRYRDLLVPGSYLAISHGTVDKQSPKSAQRLLGVYRNTDTMPYSRSKSQIEWFFDGLELVPPYEGAPPGVTFIGYWGCEDPKLADDDSNRWFYAGVGRVV